jgi:hypothetical protein
MNIKRILLISFVLALSITAIGQEGVPASIKLSIVRQMILNGDIEISCSADIYPEQLDDDKQPEYVVSGNGSCCGGARRCNQWIYQKTQKGYRKIFGGREGLQGDIDILKTRTNGYRDIRSSMYSGDTTFQDISKYNGRSYKVVKKSLKSIRTGF